MKDERHVEILKLNLSQLMRYLINTISWTRFEV